MQLVNGDVMLEPSSVAGPRPRGVTSPSDRRHRRPRGAPPASLVRGLRVRRRVPWRAKPASSPRCRASYCWRSASLLRDPSSARYWLRSCTVMRLPRTHLPAPLARGSASGPASGPGSLARLQPLLVHDPVLAHGAFRLTLAAASELLLPLPCWPLPCWPPPCGPPACWPCACIVPGADNNAAIARDARSVEPFMIVSPDGHSS